MPGQPLLLSAGNTSCEDVTPAAAALCSTDRAAEAADRPAVSRLMAQPAEATADLA
jgi:hypothetical protein